MRIWQLKGLARQLLASQIHHRDKPWMVRGRRRNGWQSVLMECVDDQCKILNSQALAR